jgi:hypothetical protein
VALSGMLASCERAGEARVGRLTPPMMSRVGYSFRYEPNGSPVSVMISLAQIRVWSEQLCTLPPVDFAAALSALGISGSLVAKTRDYSIVEPPPTGASRLGLTRENLGKNKGYLGEVAITLSGVRITRADLDARFGVGSVAPHVDFDRPYVVEYRVEIAGAPFRCTVLASFANEPTPTSVATDISLLRNVVKVPVSGTARDPASSEPI